MIRLTYKTELGYIPMASMDKIREEVIKRTKNKETIESIKCVSNQTIIKYMGAIEDEEETLNVNSHTDFTMYPD